MIFSARGGTALQRKGLVLPEKWTKRASEGHQMPSMVTWRSQNILCVFTQRTLVIFLAETSAKPRKRRQCQSHSMSICPRDFLGLGSLFSQPILLVPHKTTSKNVCIHFKCWHFENSRQGEVILSWDGQSVKSRTARYVAQGTPVKVKTVIDTYKNRLWILTFMATLDFYMFCSVQNNRSFFVDRSREINNFRHAPFAHNHKLYKRILTIFY